MIKCYFSNYLKYFSEKWSWEIDPADNDTYIKFRARKYNWKTEQNDKLPYFDSIEKDADQFNMRECVFTDIFGIRWKGKKGCFEYANDPDYEQHLYYNSEDDGDDEVCVSEKYTQENPPKFPEWFCLNDKNGKLWQNIKDVKSAKYEWILENHLFKDSKIVLEYNDGSIDEIYDIVNFMVQAKTTYPKIYDKLIIEINKHFDALKNSEKEDIKEQWPKKAAKEYMEEMVELHSDITDEDKDS